MCIILARSYISINNKSKQHFDFTRAGNHVNTRLYAVSLGDGRVFYSWTLLQHCKCFLTLVEIQIVNGVQYQWFREAYKGIGLLSDDVEWMRALADSFRSKIGQLTHVTSLPKFWPTQTKQSANHLERSSWYVHPRHSQSFLNDSEDLVYGFY